MTSAMPAANSRPSDPLVTGEFAFTLADFRQIANLIKNEAGIDLQESKATLVYSRLAKRLRARSIPTFSAYCAAVREDEDERNCMIAALTTNVTRFFREPHHFEHLRQHIVEPLAASARKGNRVRLWSAACSSGQEPYSMALTVLSVIPEAASLDIKILATDLNPHVIAHGKRGLYQAEDIRDIPAPLRAKWFSSAADQQRGAAQAHEDVRSLVSFRQLNLMGQWPFKGPFDAIFCRNVVIYFDRDTQNTIWQRLTRLLTTDGGLYIGHSERLSGPAAQSMASEGITTYRRTKRGAV